MAAGLRFVWPSCVSLTCRTVVAVLAVNVALVSPARAGFDPAATFNLQCAGCHSVGKGEVVGPDLKGVAARHDRPWLHSFIRSSQGLIAKGEKSASALFAKYKKRMPDHDFSDADIDALLAFIAAGGPKDSSGELRQASTATAAEVIRGRRLFAGLVPLQNGGAACTGCHAAGNATRWRSGTLASDLTRVYGKYRDAGLTRALLESRFPLMAAAYHDQPLTLDEAFALKAFLFHVSRAPERAPELAAGAPLLLGLGGSSLALLFTGRILRRRGDPLRGDPRKPPTD
jgi:mono/diheme cytochrome c family protein